MTFIPMGLVPGAEPPVGGTSVSQFGLTVTFDQTYTIGQYVTGDWWVAGSPTVVNIDPAWDGERHGAMINPTPGSAHSYHTKVNGYAAALNVATQLPRQLVPGDSLIVTRGWTQGEPGAPVVTDTMPGAPRPSVRDAMVLTCVATPPPADAFRPQYCAGPKNEYTLSQINWGLLTNLASVASEPSWADINQRVARPWIDHLANFDGRYTHPSNNMPDYGRDIAGQTNEVILKLLLDYPQADKQAALIGIVQFGIDSAGVTRSVHDGGVRSNWWAEFGGGHGLGRQWPTLFAGIMLNSPTLLGIAAYEPVWWGEIGQIYVSPGASANTFNRPAGTATWGERAHTRPGSVTNGRPGTTSYRTCCTTKATMGATLAALIMGREQDLDRAEAPLTEYTDWFVNIDQAGDDNRGLTAFMRNMWDAYRANY